MKDPIFQLCDIIREIGYAIHKYLGPGHLEIVYGRALKHRLEKIGHTVQPQFAIPVFDEDGTPLGEFFADLMVDGVMMIELKAAKAIATDHVAQLLGYLRAGRIEHGLLINFGAAKFEIKKYIMTRKPQKTQ